MKIDIYFFDDDKNIEGRLIFMQNAEVFMHASFLMVLPFKIT